MKVSMQHDRRKAIVFITMVFLILFAVDAEAQCAMCKAAAESNLENDPKSIARGLNKGILFLMAAPYVIVGFIFRKDLVILFKNMKSQSKVPLSKERKQWLRFSLSFATILLILFIIFVKVQYDAKDKAEAKKLEVSN
ncbi:MAG: hypothetical protein IPG89_08975 [Bacteroidetes bacterium]|jgi:hypothetical protein|nr:hypothetical protein [Bacteroidota bacterium]